MTAAIPANTVTATTGETGRWPGGSEGRGRRRLEGRAVDRALNSAFLHDRGHGNTGRMAGRDRGSDSLGPSGQGRMSRTPGPFGPGARLRTGSDAPDHERVARFEARAAAARLASSSAAVGIPARAP